MASDQTPIFSVGDFLAVVNQTLEYAYPFVEIEGEVASFKVNQNKFVFFDLKDGNSSVGCFMTVWQLRIPIEDGMKVVVRAVPKVTQWGKFSLTVQSIRPSGEGSLKKSFELLVAKLDKEGLFSPERKRTLPSMPQHIAVISSTQAAGYADFVKILNDRWGGAQVDVAHVQVQGEAAPDQIIRAIRYFNEQEKLPEVLVIIRGGGSADDLSAFNDELLAREIAGSRIPTLVGVGHEVDQSLADMVADVRAATPSNAAQIVVPDKREIARWTRQKVLGIVPRLDHVVGAYHAATRQSLERAWTKIDQRQQKYEDRLLSTRRVLVELNPRQALQRGYAIVRGSVRVGTSIEVETAEQLIQAEVTHVSNK